MFSPAYRFTWLSLFLLAAITGCASHGSEFLGKWVNTHNQNDTMRIERNGDQFLLSSQTNKVGAIYKDGVLQISSAFGGGVNLTYVKSSDTIIAPTLLGQAEYKRQK